MLKKFRWPAITFIIILIIFLISTQGYTPVEIKAECDESFYPKYIEDQKKRHLYFYERIYSIAIMATHIIIIYLLSYLISLKFKLSHIKRMYQYIYEYMEYIGIFLLVFGFLLPLPWQIFNILLFAFVSILAGAYTGLWLKMRKEEYEMKKNEIIREMEDLLKM